MTTLPVPILWLFMLFYFTFGQISDISTFDDSFKRLDAAEKFNNTSSVLLNDAREIKNQSDLQNRQLETKKKKDEAVGENFSDALKDKTGNPRAISSKTQEFGRIESSERINARGKRRPFSQKPITPSNVSEIPLMSPERRNSYLSIAERRKYYNKTQERTRKPEIIDVELENQETNNKIVTVSILDTLQTNEIPVSKKPALKESNRIAVEKKNPSNSQKALVNFSSNEKQKKFQTSRQSVIQSQFEFGQKLNLKKPPSRVQDSQDEKIRRNRDKIKSDQLNADNSTNKIVQTYSTQSTKLLRVNKNVWVTTLAPEIYGEQNDGVEHKNKTDVMNLAEFIALNRTQEVANAFSGSINSTSFVDNQVSENSGPTKAPMLQAIRLTPSPLPLSYENVSAKRDAAEDEEIKRLASSIQNVYNQEILRLNSTRKSVKVPLSVLRSFGRNPKENSTKTIATTEFDSIDSSTPVPLTTQPDLKPSNAMSFEEPSVLLKASNKTKTESTLKSQLSFAGERAENATIPSEAFVHSNPTLFNSKVDNNRTKFNSTDVTTPSGTLVPEASFNRSDENPKTQIKESDSSSPNPEKKFSTISTKEVNAFVSSTPSLKLPNTNKEYPLTIELNENNKRVLSEMFQTPKINEASKIKIPITSNSSSLEFTIENVQTTTEEITTTTVGSVQETANDQEDITMDDFHEEDRKAMGTRYNTKFYISPNVSRNHQKVIKVVDNEDDEEDEDEGGVTLVTRPVGMAAYVLAAFGIVPLLLAVVFATKFLMQRRQRRYDCESDGKSDSISTSDCQMRQSKKMKNSNELKKTPSNVTTTTLVTASRLPRVQHWEHGSGDKQAKNNWEFPRANLKMKTILGQGNFGQVWKAEIEDMAGHEGMTRLVAVKAVKEGATEKEHKEFIKELEIMQQIGSHPNIVTLLGCCTDQEPHYLIMEYVKYGKLLTYLREHRVNENYYNFSNNADALTSKDLTVFAYCISRGMEYLASRGIIHRDLAARNVLVDHNKVCKIADFGMSRSVRNFEDGQVYEERQHKGALPIRWMAPESLVYSVFTYKSDVWSFGIVMWEIVTLGSTPYPNMGAREIMRRVRDGYRLERPSHCKPEFYRLMSHCWYHDPNKRPDFSELRKDLSNLLENPAKDGSYVDLDRFAIVNGFHVSGKSKDHHRLLERKEFKALKRLGDWEGLDWPNEMKRSKIRKGKNDGKGTVTLTGQGSFTVNSRILEKELKMI